MAAVESAAHNDLLKVFAGKDKTVKDFLVHKEHESVMAHYSRVQGVGDDQAPRAILPH